MSIQEYTVLPVWRQAEYSDNGLVNNADERKEPVWSGKQPPPEIGAKVHLRINNLGAAEVKAYFVQEGYLGLIVVLDNAPKWYVEQNGGAKKPGHVFGAEIR